MLRADALATLYLFHPLRKLAGQTNRIPILMYHSVSDTREQTHPYYRTVTAPSVFAKQMEYLSRNGYSTIRPAEAVDYMQGRGDVSGRPVVITFDDGFLDFYTNAFPVMERYGFRATVYLPTAYIRPAAREFKGTDCLTWSQVRELQSADVEFGSHTVSHPQLQLLNALEVRRELRDSKTVIENELGCAVGSFAYPYAFPETDRVFTTMLRETLAEAGYQTGVSTIIGTADQRGDRFFMPRLPVNSCDDPPLLKAKLEGGYDWLHRVQYVNKTVKRLLG
jgi:peptidoglycan/xylan/chitin deacetylase (PgdA/CDA1 family)